MYTSPQMLRGEKYDEKIDIWAIGILTYELLIGRIPFRIMCEDDLQRIVHFLLTLAHRPDHVPRLC
jgi:serine/threonine protein kinase